MKEAALVFLGGGAGSALRYLVSVMMLKKFGPVFPWGTFTVNVAGCLAIGLLIGWLDLRLPKHDPELRLLIAVGFCGGFTTFSSFALDNIRLLQTGHPVAFLLYTAGSVVLGLAAAVTGLYIGRLLMV